MPDKHIFQPLNHQFGKGEKGGRRPPPLPPQIDGVLTGLPKTARHIAFPKSQKLILLLMLWKVLSVYIKLFFGVREVVRNFPKVEGDAPKMCSS